MTDCEKMKDLYDDFKIGYSYYEKDCFGDMVIFLHGTNAAFTFNKDGKFICKEIRI